MVYHKLVRVIDGGFLKMTVLEFIEMFVDESEQYFELWDNVTEKIIFQGFLADLTEELENSTVTSIDNITNGTNGITLNVDIDWRRIYKWKELI